MLSPSDLRASCLPESLLDWTGEPLHRLVREIERGLSRRADAGDLLVVLASAQEGIAARALAELGIDAEQLAQAAERVRAGGPPADFAPDSALLAQSETVRVEKEAAIAAREYERAANRRDRERELRREACEAREVAEEHLCEQLATDVRARLGLSKS